MHLNDDGTNGTYADTTVKNHLESNKLNLVLFVNIK